MQNYDSMYKKIGTRKLIHFIKPRIIKQEDFLFPRQSCLSFYKEEMLPTCPSQDLGYLKQYNSLKEITIDKYTNPIGKVKSSNKNIKSYISDCKKANPKVTYFLPKQKVKLKPNDLLIINYGIIHFMYHYIPDKLNDYYKTYNGMVTLLELTKQIKDRHHFIHIDVPADIPDLKIYEHFVKKNVDNNFLKTFITAKDRIIFELYKWLDDENFRDSIFHILSKDKEHLKNVDFIFTFNKKMVLVNSEKLFGMVKNNNIDTNITKVSSKHAKIILLAFLKAIEEQPATDIENIPSDDKIKVILKGENINDLLSNNNIDKKDKKDNKIEIKALRDKLEADDDFEDLPTDINTDDDLKENEVEDIVKNISKDLNMDETIKEKEEEKEIPLEDLLYKKETMEDYVDMKIKDLELNDKIKKKDIVAAKEILKQQETKLSPYIGDRSKLKDLLVVKQEEIEIKEDEKKIPDIKTVIDKTMLESTNLVLDKKYIKNTLKKDTVSVIYDLQKSGLLVSDHMVEEGESVLGKYEIHHIELKPLSGRTMKISFKLPKIDEDGTFKVAGNTYTLRKQKADIPIKKIEKNKVSLSSYYGKVFVTKATFKKNDLGFWFRKELVKRADLDKSLNNLILLSAENTEVKVPYEYSIIARYVKGFKFKGFNFTFDYQTRTNLLKTIKELNKIEHNGKYVLIASNLNTNEYLVMDFNNKLYKYKNGKYEEQPDLIKDQLQIDLNQGPIEYALMKLYKVQLPVVVVLSYYLGLKTLMKTLKANWRITENSREKIKDTEYKVKFKDVTLILDRKDKLATMILGGLLYIEKDLKELNFENMNSKAKITALFNLLDLQVNHLTEIKLLETMFVDSITKTLLEELKEPTNFKGLLIRASELLLTDYYKHPNSLEEMVIKGYERVPGMVYNQLVKSLKDYENRSLFGQAKLNLDPYGIIKDINSDSTCMLVDDLNPITVIKQRTEVTMMGQGGRSKETLVKKTREQHVSEIGVISESSKDSSDVGITGYLSANPGIVSTRGVKAKDIDIKKKGLSSYMSDSAVLHAGSVHDDTKRLNFISIMNSHLIPLNGLKAPSVRTGYENIIPFKTSEKYAYMAEDDCTVTGLTKSEIKLTFKDGREKKLFLGKWSTKEESGISYIHEVITNRKLGDKLKKGWSVCWDKLFFEEDIFNKQSLIFKYSINLKVALIEKPQTWEDSSAMSARIANKLNTKVLKVKSYILDVTNEILNMVKPGEKVKSKTPLFIINSAGSLSSSGLDEKSLATLQNIKMAAPKAKVNGKISKIKIFYNSDLENASKSIKELIKESDNEIKKETKNRNLTGRVSGEYSVKGRPLLDGQCEIKIYIEVDQGMGVGDKGIVGNQLKSTIGEVYDYPIKTESGEDIDMLFSNKAIQARIVTSPTIIGSTATLLSVIKDKAVKMYFGDKAGNEELNPGLEENPLENIKPNIYIKDFELWENSYLDLVLKKNYDVVDEINEVLGRLNFHINKENLKDRQVTVKSTRDFNISDGITTIAFIPKDDYPVISITVDAEKLFWQLKNPLTPIFLIEKIKVKDGKFIYVVASKKLDPIPSDYIDELKEISNITNFLWGEIGPDKISVWVDELLKEIDNRNLKLHKDTKEQIMLLNNILKKLKSKTYTLDLHTGNWLYNTEEKKIVLTDPIANPTTLAFRKSNNLKIDKKDLEALPSLEEIEILLDELIKENFNYGVEDKKIKIKEKGKFKNWCIENGYDGVNCECICKALKSDDVDLHKEANFAYNFGFKAHDKKCECVEKLRNKK